MSVGNEEFTATHWSVVLKAGDAESPEAGEAVARLCERYWYPLYAYVRRKGNAPQDAQDLTQAFFARLLEKDMLGRVDPAKGRFRSFLLASMKHFLSDEWDKARAQKRGGGVEMISIDDALAEERFGLEPKSEQSPERLYDRRWAMTLLEVAMGRLEQEYKRRGSERVFRALGDSLLGGGTRSHAEIGAELSMSESAVKVATHRMRKAFRRQLRDEVAQTVGDEAEVDAELRVLMEILRG